MNQRELYCSKIATLEKACRATRSKKLKNDYEKAIRRMKKDLQIYDYYHQENYV